MYSRIDFNTSNELHESKSKKKYELSLKRSKFAVVGNNHGTVHDSVDIAEMTTDVSASQDFKLRVSDSFVVEDTQESKERNDARLRNIDVEEVILISDSDDDATPEVDEWTSLKASELLRDERKKSITPPSTIYTIRSSDSEDNVRNERGTWKPEVSSDFVTIRKCSVTYTSDETLSDVDSRSLKNKENLLPRTRMMPEIDDESMFSFERMRGVLTENRRNIDNRESPKSLKKTSEKREIARKTPTSEKNPRDRGESPKSLKKTSEKREIARKTPSSDKRLREMAEREKISREISERIDEWKRNERPSRISKNATGSLKNLAEIGAKVGESYRPRDLTKSARNKTGSLKDIAGRIEDGPRIGESSKTKTSSLHNLREINERERTPEAARRVGKEGTGSSSEVKSSRGISSRATVLSRRDVRNIMKVVESKRAIYQSPRDHEKPSNPREKKCSLPDSEDDSRGVEKKPAKPVVIEETDSDSDDEVIRGSQVDLAKPYKTHVTRFLDPSANHDCTPDSMSERKKLEIAHWLMNNEGHSRSESSLSVVTPSNRNSPSSGNSSLDRLEMNYETPNNRDKMKKKTVDGRTDSAKSAKFRQITIDHFLKKHPDGDGLVLTPTPVTRNEKNVPESAENLDIMDCADILDNLYGSSWRSRANDLLPSTEPRKKNVLLRDKGVQTERKCHPKSRRAKKSSDSDSQDDGFDAFVQNIKPNFNSTKKFEKKPARQRCSFINDSPSSTESTGETTYLTALTNPRISDDHKIQKLPAPASLLIQRAIAICDSDTDDDDEKLTRPVDTKKILSYTDDESDSVTSEYDPDDVVPPKNPTKPRGGFAKSKNLEKNTRTPSSTAGGKTEKSRKTFLESLSTTMSINEAHPDAIKYRRDYKSTKEELCRVLYKLYNEKIFDKQLPSDLSIEWNVRMRGTAGFCYNKRSVKALGGVTRSSRIVLATKILDTPDRLRDTLVHEMCHAAAWLINDVSDGHGPFWKAWASKAMRTFPELPPIKRCHDYKITTKYTYRCTGCGYSVGRHSKSLDIETKRCGHCYAKFELLINKVTKTGKVETKTPVAKKPSGFALFVKDNYSSVKKERKGVSHKELMQILGQQFSAIKITKNNHFSDENNRVSID